MAIQPGSLLVIPKRHAPTIVDMTADEAGAVMRMVRVVSSALVAVLDPVGLNIFQNNGIHADQRVPHCHVHVVPRYVDDGGTFKTSVPVTPAERRSLAGALQPHI